MKTRAQLARELLETCPDEQLPDVLLIAAAIRRGDTFTKISWDTPLAEYPETYTWLKNELINRG